MTQAQLADIMANNEKIAYQDFNRRFKEKIEQGYNMSQFARDFNINQSDIAMFERLTAEVENEKKLGEAFVAGFQSR